MKCSKCHHSGEDDDFLKFARFSVEGSTKINLCYTCNTYFESAKESLIFEFLKDDFGNCPISQITKNIINARKARNTGNSPWKTNDQNM